MKVVAYTDVIQVAVLIIGGLVTSYIALTTVGQYRVGENAIAGFKVSANERSSRAFQNVIIPEPTASSSQNDINKYLTFLNGRPVNILIINQLLGL
jgi:SSS family solute:Na+ symporter